MAELSGTIEKKKTKKWLVEERFNIGINFLILGLLIILTWIAPGINQASFGVVIAGIWLFICFKWKNLE